MKLFCFPFIALLILGCTNNEDAPPTDATVADTDTDSVDLSDTSDDSSSDSESAASQDTNNSVDTETLVWRMANLTWFESYPEEGSTECIDYNGCEWAGWFAGLDEQMSPEWVENNNIAAVHSDHFTEFGGKTLRVRYGDAYQIDVIVYDMCADSDCDGCCTDNMFATGFLIDMEIHTAQRFGVMDGIVEFACLNCAQ